MISKMCPRCKNHSERLATGKDCPYCGYDQETKTVYLVLIGFMIGMALALWVFL